MNTTLLSSALYLLTSENDNILVVKKDKDIHAYIVSTNVVPLC